MKKCGDYGGRTNGYPASGMTGMRHAGAAKPDFEKIKISWGRPDIGLLRFC